MAKKQKKESNNMKKEDVKAVFTRVLKKLKTR